MEIIRDIDWKSLIIGAAISAAVVIFASGGYDWLYPFSAIGIIYVGYKAKNITQGTLLGAVAAIPLCILALQGAFGEITGTIFNETTTQLLMIVILLIVGAVIGFVGALAHRDRQKAIEEHERKSKIGKNKKKK